MKTGDKAIVFDYRAWNNKDVGDNSQFWRPATILRIYKYGTDEVADVRFDHDGRESRGHFTSGMRAVPVGQTA